MDAAPGSAAGLQGLPASSFGMKGPGGGASMAAAAAGWGAGDPGDSHRAPPGGRGRPAAGMPVGLADKTCGHQVPLGHGTSDDSVLEGRKWG